MTTAQPHDRLWQLGATPALAAGDVVEVLAVPESMQGTPLARLVGCTGTVLEVHDYAGYADELGYEALYEVQVRGFTSRCRRSSCAGSMTGPLHLHAGGHPVGDMDPRDPERFRLSALAERRAARSWIAAAVSAHSTAEVLACTQLGRTALRQAHEYDELAAELGATG